MNHNSPSLRKLIHAVTAVVDRNSKDRNVAEHVAEILQPYLGKMDLLTDEQMQPDDAGYKQQVLHVARDGRFSVVSLVWLPGQSTPIHSHVAWCVAGVHIGREEERRYWLGGTSKKGRLVEIGRSITMQGSVTSLVPPGDVHRVLNSGRELSVSLHVYGADIRRLGSSIEERFSLVGASVLPTSGVDQFVVGARSLSRRAQEC